MTSPASIDYRDIAGPLNEPVCNRLRDAIADSRTRRGGHIAVTGQLYSGREEIIERLAAESGSEAAIHSFTAPVHDVVSELGPYTGVPLLFINNAHYLATRKIGGFAPIESFRSFLAGTSSTVISGWNTIGWNYCSAVTGIDAYHNRIIDVSPFLPEQFQSIINARFDGSIRYVNDATLWRSFVESSLSHKVKIPFTDRKITVPWISVDPAILASALSRKKREKSPEDAIFSRIARVSQGNPGLAAEVWNASLDYPELRLSRIHEPPIVARLSVDECFVLATILMLESVTPGDLTGIHGPMAEEVLHMLRSRDLFHEAEGKITIRPVLANSVLTHLRGIKAVA